MYNGNDDGIILFYGKFATGPTPIVIANQVMYRAIEYWPLPSRWPTDFQAAVISCDLSKFTGMEEDDPIMNSNNWRITPPVPFDKNWVSKSYPILIEPGFLELNQTTNNLSFVSIIKFPGGMTKFTIRYDPVTETYFSLVNPVVSEIDPFQRNILSLSYTRDLANLSQWNILADRLLYDDTGFTSIDSLRYTGFHYVDWQFDRLLLSLNQSSCIKWNCDGGPDIIYLIRTSYRGANSFHNSNRITYKTLSNYRQLIKQHQN